MTAWICAESQLWSRIAAWFSGIKSEFVLNFITKNRWRMLLNGLGTTLLITLFSCLMGIAIGVLVATLAFGLNSGAYVAEIFRGGIMSIDKGQFEAGRSLGFNYVQTMAYIVVPQVIKNVLPALANEFISLLKETSVAGYVTVADLTYAGNRIRGVTFSPFMPLIAVALIYLVLVMFFTKLVSLLERRLRNSDH